MVGALWFLVLYPFAYALPLGGELFPFDLLAMCLASLTVAITFRQRIKQASRRTGVILSIFLPYFGSFVFGVFFAVFLALQNVATNGLLPDKDALKIPLICVVYGPFGLWFISIPMGFLSQYIMKRIAKRCA